MNATTKPHEWFRWELKVTVTAAGNWVADGFGSPKDKEDIADRVRELLAERLLPYAHEHELQVSVETVRGPAPSAIAYAQTHGECPSGPAPKRGATPHPREGAE